MLYNRFNSIVMLYNKFNCQLTFNSEFAFENSILERIARRLKTFLKKNHFSKMSSNAHATGISRAMSSLCLLSFFPCLSISQSRSLISQKSALLHAVVFVYTELNIELTFESLHLTQIGV